ncbi:hypothetical protein CC1G_11402 [Coprinopsis cinerea okayama7|uniref:Uncharacterized protein n=1 Tax=Coprinopsis cinerea (strain Okayama-7 / 130 / ATCC MYA-4618 / FGSC 9003) TaxID=240176 RepID=A8PGL4_COPC7|nr:hypothetical protein CC1G_11402 [Coprinopsis cinerea okayama7\|eukprot:XP_001841239.2 hypothetical protein CC1G_11402 [Coprinopsis cinerea okayama7\
MSDVTPTKRASLPLPAELLGLIFTFATAGYEIEDFIDLALVCKEFRDVLFTTPALWTNLSVVYGEKTPLGKLSTQLKTLFERSKNLPVQLSLHHDGPKLHSRMDLLTGFLVDELPPRVESLALSVSYEAVSFTLLELMGSNTDWMSDFLGMAGTKPFESLSTLRLHSHSGPLRIQPDTFQKGFPNLKRLDLRALDFYQTDPVEGLVVSNEWPTVDLTGLQKLNVLFPVMGSISSSTPTVLLPSILSQAPELQSLNVYLSPGPRTPPPPTLTHKQLGRLGLKGTLKGMICQLSTVILPGLRSLRLERFNSLNIIECSYGDGNLERSIASTIIKLAEASKCQLEDIVLVHIMLSEEEIEELVHSLLSLVSLTIVTRRWDYTIEVRRVLGPVNPDAGESDDLCFPFNF